MSVLCGIYLSLILITKSLLLGILLGAILYCYVNDTELDEECLKQTYKITNLITDTINICSLNICSFSCNKDFDNNTNYYRII